MARRSGSRPLLPAAVDAKTRAHQVMQLRIAGLSQEEIAERVGLSQSRVSRIITAHLQEQRAQDTNDLRALEVERTEQLHRAVWPKALRGDAGAASVVLRAGDRRARLLGLDEGGDGAPGGGPHVVVSVWLECFVLDSQEAMNAVGEEAQRLGLQSAQALLPGATVDAVKTRMYWIHLPRPATTHEMDAHDYAHMLAHIADGQSIGV